MDDWVRTFTPRVVTFGRGEAAFAIDDAQGFFRRGLRAPLLTGAWSVVSPESLETVDGTLLGRGMTAEAVNRLLECGAEPVFVALVTSGLDAALRRALLGGVVDGCRDAGCPLAPAVSAPAGAAVVVHAVGVVEQRKLIDGGHVKGGDLVLGLRSGGALPGLTAGGAPLAAVCLNRPVIQVMKRYRRYRPVHAVAAAASRVPGTETPEGILARLEGTLGTRAVVRVTARVEDLAKFLDPFWPEGAADVGAALRGACCGLALLIAVERRCAWSIERELRRRGVRSMFIGELERPGAGR